MAKLRLGVIGAGFWAVYNHIPVFAGREEVELVAVNRLGAEPLRAVQEKFGFERASEDYRDVLEAGVDIVLVASPTALHHEHAKAALEAGAHVLCEKPFTIAPEDAWDLVRTSERVGKHLLLSYGWNYKPMSVRAKELMDTGGGVGEIEHVMVHMASVTRELMSATGDYNLASDITAPQPQTWSDPKLSGGGYGQAQITHALGLTLWLTGLRGQEVFARMHDLGGRAPVELHDAISLSYTNGAIGAISGASCPAGAGNDKHQVDVRIFGSEGQLLIDLEHERLWRYRTKDDDVLVDLPPGSGTYDCAGPPNTLVDLALGKDVPNNSPGELGARTVEILEAAYRSAASGVSEACRHADAVPA